MNPGTIFLIIIVAILALLFVFLKSPTGKGVFGEFRVKLRLGKTKEGERYVLNNVMIVEDGKSSQIDHIVINQNGVFVIETKNYAGRIYGKDEQRQWTQVLQYGRVKNHFYNPVKQNATHIYRLKNVLPKGTPIQSVVVFVRDNTKYIESNNVYNLRGMKRVINSNNGNFMAPDEMKEAYDALVNAKNSNNVTNREHINEIHKMQNDIAHNICPRCGGELILRHGKNGYFYGCSNYPKCKFTKKAD